MRDRHLVATTETLVLKEPFRISGYEFTESTVLRVTLSEGRYVGRGEASGVYYMADGPEQMMAVIERHREEIEAGICRHELMDVMPAGGARNAVDCALWDLEAKRSGVPVWRLADLASVSPLRTTFTVGADAPERMAEAAKRHDQAHSLKLKLTGDLDLDLARVRAVRAARPEAWIGVDGNQGFRVGDLEALAEGLCSLGVALLEQPLPRGQEEELDRCRLPISLAADESFLTLDDAHLLPGRFQVGNIKLDKCGGLTEALQLVGRLRELGLGVMVGCMTGSSLAMAPAFIAGQLCDLVDLDGPTFLRGDWSPSVRYEGGNLWCDDAVWGGPVSAAAA